MEQIVPYVIMYRDNGDIRRVTFSFCVFPFRSVPSNTHCVRALDQANRCWLFSRCFWFSSKMSRARCMVHKVTLSQVLLGYFVLRLELLVIPPLFSVICHSSEHHTHLAPHVIIHQSTIVTMRPMSSFIRAP
jgi:hypothetical protein